MSQTTNAGIVTAYGAAVRGGYEGTYDQFCADLAQLATVLAQLTNMSAVAETLAAGSSATASYEDGVLTLGIPRGDTGNGIQSISLISTVGLVKTYRITFTDEDHFDFEVKDGNGISSATLNQDYTLTLTFNDGTTWTSTSIRGATGATPNLTIGTVSTAAPGSSAAAEITGTPEDPVLNLTIPKGDPGEVPAAAIASTQASTTASKKILEGEYFFLSGTLYIATAEIASGGTIVTSGSGANCKTAKVADDVSNLKSAIDSTEDHAIAAFPQETLENQRIASFTDGADDIPIKELTVHIEPVQDLHGYDNPWPAGGGKNLYNAVLSTNSVNGIDFTNDNGIITASGTATANVYKVNHNFGFIYLEAGSYIATGGDNIPTGDFRLADNRNSSQTDSGSVAIGTITQSEPSLSFTLSSAQYIFFNIIVASGATGNYTYKPMIRLSTVSDDTWEPYSNICPISGHTECEVTRTGKNLIPSHGVSRTSAGIEYTVNPDGSIHVSGTATASSWWKGGTTREDWDFIKAGTYKLTGGKSNGRTLYIVGQYVDGESVKDTSVSGGVYDRGSGLTFTLSKDAYITYQIQIRNGEVIDDTFYPMIRLATDTDDTWKPCTADTYPITFPSEAGTVYGGTLTVHQDGTGSLVVDRAKVTFGTDVVFEKNVNDGVFKSSTHLSNAKSGVSQGRTDCICSCYKTEKFAQSSLDVDFACNYANSSFGNNTRIFIKDSVAFEGTAEAFNTKVQGQTFVYSLSTPITYTLTAEQITTLLGDNNVWHSCNGNLDLTYRADLAKYITKDSIQHYIKFSGMIAGVETGLTASKPYNSGEYFIVSQKLYKATASIASGATFTVGTNCTETTVGAELVELNT